MNKDISTHQAEISGTIPVSNATSWVSKDEIFNKRTKKEKRKSVVRPYSGISTIKALAVLILRFISIVYHVIYNEFCSLTGISKSKK